MKCDPFIKVFGCGFAVKPVGNKHFFFLILDNDRFRIFDLEAMGSEEFQIFFEEIPSDIESESGGEEPEDPEANVEDLFDINAMEIVFVDEPQEDLLGARQLK